MNIQKVRFYRTEENKKAGSGEDGIMINEGNGPIIDAQGQVVPNPVWDYRYLNHELCITIPLEGERDHEA